MRAITVESRTVVQVTAINLQIQVSVPDQTANICTQSQNRHRTTIIGVVVAVVLQTALVVRVEGAVVPEAHLAPAEADTVPPTSSTRATRPRPTPRTSPSSSTSSLKIMRIFTKDRCRASYSRSNYCTALHQPFQSGSYCFYRSTPVLVYPYSN